MRTTIHFGFGDTLVRSKSKRDLRARGLAPSQDLETISNVLYSTMACHSPLPNRVPLPSLYPVPHSLVLVWSQWKRERGGMSLALT